MIHLAPEARQKVARGKRFARRPWLRQLTQPALKGRKYPRKTEYWEMMKFSAIEHLERHVW